MPTPINEIYEDFFLSIESETLALKRDFLVKRTLLKYLKNSISRFMTCKKSINIVGNIVGDVEIPKGKDLVTIKGEFLKEPNLEVYYVRDDGTDVLLERDIDYILETNVPINETQNNESVEIEYKIKLKNIATDTVYVDYNSDGIISVGENDEELTLLEKRIIVEGMVLEWLVYQINREDNLRNRVSNKEFKKLSNATLLSSLMKIERQRKREYNQLIKKYSYVGFEGFN